MENEKKTATSNAEMVTISRAEYESQQAQLTELKLQNQWLLEQLGLAKKREFGSSSERIREELMDQLAFSLNEAEAYAYGTKYVKPPMWCFYSTPHRRFTQNLGWSLFCRSLFWHSCSVVTYQLN